MNVESPLHAVILVLFGILTGFLGHQAYADTPRYRADEMATDCIKSWEEGLSRCDTTPDTYVVIRKSARALAWCESGKLMKVFETGLGFAPSGDKKREGDGQTPLGTFYIPRRIPSSQFYRAFNQLPDIDDANDALKRGSISAWQHRSIVQAQKECREPPQTTSLGGLIEVHGDGGSSDWTLGCIAVDNTAIDQLWRTLDVGDSVIILP